MKGSWWVVTSRAKLNMRSGSELPRQPGSAANREGELELPFQVEEIWHFYPVALKIGQLRGKIFPLDSQALELRSHLQETGDPDRGRLLEILSGVAG